MKRRYLQATMVLVLLAIVGLAAYSYPRAKSISTVKDVGQKVNDKGYSTDMKELRVRFNQDKGKVRVILLLSPT
jgi:hypothetical protein